MLKATRILRDRIDRRSDRLLLVLALFIMVPPSSGFAYVPSMSQDDDPRLTVVHNLIYEASFDSALVILNTLTADESLSPADREATFRLKGLVYTIQGKEELAEQSVYRLIEMNPDAVAVDPDRDMLDFVRLYFRVRKEYNEKNFCPSEYEAPHPCQFLLERPDPGIKTIAIIDFDNNAIDERERLEPLRAGLADLMIRLLNGRTDLQIVERERLDWLLAEIGLNQDRSVDARTAVRVGKLMGAHTVLLGDFMYMNDRFTLGARLVKVETGEVLLGPEAKGRLEDFDEIVRTFSEALVKQIPDLDPGPLGQVPTHDLNALLSYAEGIELLDAGDIEGAADKFQETLVYDPGHEPARKRFDALRPLIAGATH